VDRGFGWGSWLPNEAKSEREEKKEFVFTPSMISVPKLFKAGLKQEKERGGGGGGKKKNKTHDLGGQPPPNLHVCEASKRGGKKGSSTPPLLMP